MKNKWVLFIVLYLSALTVSLSQLKIVTVMGNIAETFMLTIPQVSWLMSVFTVAGIILAIPGAAVLGKLGPKKLLLCLLGALVLGNFLGAVATSYSVLLLSRVVEGISFALIILVGIVLISEWFAGGNVGLAIGTYTTFPALGSVIAFNTSLPIVESMGLKSIWIIVAVIGIICFLLVSAIIKIAPPLAASEANASETPPAEQVSVSEAFANGKIWLLAICQCAVAFVLFTFITIYPQLFSDLYALEPSTANFYASLNGLFGIPFCILSGIIIDKTKNAPMVTFVAFVGMIIACFLTTKLGISTYILHTLLIALFCGLVIPAVLYVAPSVAKKPALIGYSISVVNLLYYIGIFAGAPAVLGAIASSGWQAGTNYLIIASAIGAFSILLFMITSSKKKENA